MIIISKNRSKEKENSHSLGGVNQNQDQDNQLFSQNFGKKIDAMYQDISATNVGTSDPSNLNKKKAKSGEIGKTAAKTYAQESVKDTDMAHGYSDSKKKLYHDTGVGTTISIVHDTAMSRKLAHVSSDKALAHEKAARKYEKHISKKYGVDLNNLSPQQKVKLKMEGTLIGKDGKPVKLKESERLELLRQMNLLKNNSKVRGKADMAKMSRKQNVKNMATRPFEGTDMSNGANALSTGIKGTQTTAIMVPTIATAAQNGAIETVRNGARTVNGAVNLANKHGLVDKQFYHDFREKTQKMHNINMQIERFQHKQSEAMKAYRKTITHPVQTVYGGAKKAGSKFYHNSNAMAPLRNLNHSVSTRVSYSIGSLKKTKLGRDIINTKSIVNGKIDAMKLFNKRVAAKMKNKFLSTRFGQLLKKSGLKIASFIAPLIAPISSILVTFAFVLGIIFAHDLIQMAQLTSNVASGDELQSDKKVAEKIQEMSDDLTNEGVSFLKLLAYNTKMDDVTLKELEGTTHYDGKQLKEKNYLGKVKGLQNVSINDDSYGISGTSSDSKSATTGYDEPIYNSKGQLVGYRYVPVHWTIKFPGGKTFSGYGSSYSSSGGDSKIYASDTYSPSVGRYSANISRKMVMNVDTKYDSNGMDEDGSPVIAKNGDSLTEKGAYVSPNRYCTSFEYMDIDKHTQYKDEWTEKEKDYTWGSMIKAILSCSQIAYNKELSDDTIDLYTDYTRKMIHSQFKNTKYTLTITHDDGGERTVWEDKYGNQFTSKKNMLKTNAEATLTLWTDPASVGNYDDKAKLHESKKGETKYKRRDNWMHENAKKISLYKESNPRSPEYTEWTGWNYLDAVSKEEVSVTSEYNDLVEQAYQLWISPRAWNNITFIDPNDACQDGQGNGDTGFNGLSGSAGQKVFIGTIGPELKKLCEQVGIKNWKLCMAQLCLESGWGAHESGKYNYYGIKAAKGEKYTLCWTKECINGKWVKVQAKFKDFDSVEDGLRTYVSDLMRKWPGTRNSLTAMDFANALKHGTIGPYMTAPADGYAKTLASIAAMIPDDPKIAAAGDAPSRIFGKGKGVAVANEALQYVGNPYVWGGTSLTKGCDCSGFVMQIYAKFGVSLPHSSADIRNFGHAVDMDDIKAGDIICYDGHVGIADGSGYLIEAKGRKYGITHDRKYDSGKKIITVRRIFTK